MNKTKVINYLRFLEVDLEHKEMRIEHNSKKRVYLSESKVKEYLTWVRGLKEELVSE